MDKTTTAFCSSLTPDYTSLQFPNIDASMDAVNDDYTV